MCTYFYRKSVSDIALKLFFVMELHFIFENSPSKSLERISLCRRKEFYFSFNFYIYPPDTQEATEALHIGQANTPTCFRRCHNIAPQSKFYILFFSYIETREKFRTACQDRQAEESAVTCLSQAYNRMERVSFKTSWCRLQSRRS